VSRRHAAALSAAEGLKRLLKRDIAAEFHFYFESGDLEGHLHDSSLGIAYSSFVIAPPLAFHSQLERYRMSLIKVADTLSRQFQVLSKPAQARRASHGQSKSGLGVLLFAWHVFTGST
jgi:hypothetical protein